MGLAGGDKSLIIMFSRFDTFHKCNGRANEQAEFLYSTLYLVPANYLRRVVKLRRIGYAYGTPNRTPNQSDLKRRICAALVLKFIRLRIYLHLHIYDSVLHCRLIRYFCKLSPVASVARVTPINCNSRGANTIPNSLWRFDS